MRKTVLAVLYTALALGANPAMAEVGGQLQGEMRRLVLQEAPEPLPDAVFLDGADAEVPLAQWRGKWVVLNFWATWCAPCRKEMPALDRLQAAMPAIAVVPVATGRNPVPAIEHFFAEAGVKNLPVMRDPTAALAQQLGVFGLPMTFIIDPEGREVARLIGDAEWDSADAKAALAAFMASP